MRIAVDAMGGDHAPRTRPSGGALVPGAGGESEIVLVGRADLVRRALGGERRGITLVDARDVVAMHEHPASALRAPR